MSDRRLPPLFGACEDSPDLPVLTEGVFRGVLRRERKRTDRFEEPFILLKISIGTVHHWRTSEMVIAAIRRASLDAHVIGWLNADRVLGVIVPGGFAVDPSGADLASRIRRELEATFDTDALATISTEVRVEAGSDSARLLAPSEADGETKSTRDQLRAVLSRALKRALDIGGSAALLTLTAPVFAVVAALIKLTSPGPVLFRQERVGWAGRSFTMLKFRTMHVNADSGIHQQYIAQFINANKAAASGDAAFKIRNDPRVTPLGRLLRRTSVDELPQFWNVLRGEMSLVGPRPPLRYEVDQYRRWHRLRVLEAKPGITGLWQVVGRSRTTFDDMVRLDVRYARARSIWTDVKILLATPRAVISGKGAC